MREFPAVPAKRALSPIAAFSGLMKGQGAPEPSDNLSPAFSASGQDVWIPRDLARATRPGIVLSAVGARCGKVFEANFDRWGTVANTSSWAIAPGWDLRFVHYLFNRESFWIKGGAAQPYVQIEPSLQQNVSFPTIEEQRQIANFLDTHTAKIDALIGKQERLIETLAERRQAVISHAVTKGLDPNAPMKDTGVELIGQITEGWDVLPLKRLISRVEQGVSPQASSELADDASWGVVKSGCVNHGTFADVQHKRLDEGFVFDPSIQIHKGDLLVCRASGSPSLVGSAAIVRELRYRLILSDKTFRLPVNVNQNAAFIEKVLNSRLYRAQVRGAISGAVGLANNLPGSSLRQFVFPVPPVEEQVKIVEYLDQESSQMDALSAKAREMIDVLKERRQALISAAVMGKIDVRASVPMHGARTKGVTS